MKYKILFIIICFLFSFSVFSQKREEKVTLGYYCGYSGSGTSVVIKFAQLLYDKKYKTLKELLHSKIPAENFLSVVICKRLALKKIITLTELELKRIDELFHSKEKVPICGGCTFFEEVELTKLLNSNEEVFSAMDYFFDS